MDKKTYKKRCFVPLCNNDNHKNPDKIFFSVPKDPDIRKKWFQVSRRADFNSLNKTSYFCCQDHFNVSNNGP